MRWIKRNLYLYGRFIAQQLKAILEYQSDFWITLAAGAVSQVLGFVFLWVIYQNVPEINGWRFWEIVFLFAMVYFTEGFCSAFLNGIWMVGPYVNRGEFDRILVRPLPPLTQVLGTQVGMNGFGNIILGGVLIFQSFLHTDIQWSFFKVLFALLILVSAVAVRASIYLMAQAVAFWHKANNSALPFMVHSVGDFAKYPLDIFPAAVKAVICAALPYAFVSFFPAAYIFGKDGWVIGLCTPLAAAVCVSAASFVFYRGLKRYESAGN